VGACDLFGLRTQQNGLTTHFDRVVETRLSFPTRQSSFHYPVDALSSLLAYFLKLGIFIPTPNQD